MFATSAGDYLDGWFESDPIKAVYGFDGIVGNYNSPYAPGSAYVLLHHVFGEVNGKKGVWAHAIGGMGAITQAMAKCAASRGADIRVNAGVKEIIIENGTAVGAVTESGETFRASAVVSNLNPKLLFMKLHRPGRVAARVPSAHQSMALRLRHVPHECRALGVARLHVLARQAARSASHGRHHHRAVARVHGARVLRCASAGLVERADRGGADPVDARRQPRAAGPARREHVLPARRAGIAEWANRGMRIATPSRI